MTDTATLAPTDDLQKRCAEIIGWHRTGVLVGDTLRSHAESKWPGDIHNLQMAERATENEALCFIAKWGAPAPASFPVRITALLRDVADRNGTETKGPWEDVFGEPLQDDADAALAWIAAPPAQEARVPLSDGQIEQGHDAADIAPTDTTIGTFNDGVRFAEKHHGITAAQKETP